MRPLVLLLVLVMVSSCLAMNRKTMHTVDHRIHSEDRRLTEEKNTGSQEYSGSGNTVTNHHNIPRNNYNNFNGGDNGGRKL
ncbi:hypothetical protein LguiB_001019 [Lonicera macranthoides]